MISGRWNVKCVLWVIPFLLEFNLDLDVFLDALLVNSALSSAHFVPKIVIFDHSNLFMISLSDSNLLYFRDFRGLDGQCPIFITN